MSKEYLYDLFKNDIYSDIHGDFTIENIICLNGKDDFYIIDPNTGMPINNELLSVSIIGKDAVLCDALSTSLFVMGLEKSIEYWKKNNDFYAVFITKDGHIYITEGIEDDITLLDDFSNISPNIIKNEN